MTIKEALDYLNSYKKIIERIKYLKRREENLQSQKYSIKSAQSGDVNVDGGAKNEVLINLLDKIDEIEEKINIQKTVALSQQWELDEKIAKIEYPYNILLRKYYCENNTWEQIAVYLSYSFRQTMYLRKEAIKLFAVENIAQNCTLQ